ATVSDVLKMFKQTHHARYPVYDGSLDNMVGVVAMKELLTSVAEQEGGEVSLDQPVSEIMLPPFLVPETKALSELLKTFKTNRQHMAIVIDEFGGTAGVITLEDILEEIVGDYDDEFTRGHRQIKKLAGSEYIINGSIRVSELEPVVHFPFPDGEDYVTLAGLVYKFLGHIPKNGDQVDLDGGRLEVVEMEGHRITKIKFQDLALNEEGKLDLADRNSQSDPAFETEVEAPPKGVTE
ncbi:MAG: HlyC/CorC family transporter, partial [Gammaproteobacteria bacterium]|nr:HlyC/CorC family transporter [Gammaproteobacteria bacterium]